MSHIQYLDENNFEAAIAQGKVLVDFFADWCGPCKALSPILDQLAQELKETAVIAKVDITKDDSLAVKYEVTSIPTLLVFENGKLKHRTTGIKDLNTLKALLA